MLYLNVDSISIFLDHVAKLKATYKTRILKNWKNLLKNSKEILGEVSEIFYGDLRSCVIFSKKLLRIHLKIVGNSPKNWVKFSWKWCEIFKKFI